MDFQGGYMKSLIVFAGLLMATTALAETRRLLIAEPDFSTLIAQGYGEQATTYQRVHAEVESASREGEVLEDLAKKSEASEVQVKLTTVEEKKERRSRAEHIR